MSLFSKWAGCRADKNAAAAATPFGIAFLAARTFSGSLNQIMGGGGVQGLRDASTRALSAASCAAFVMTICPFSNIMRVL